MVPTDRRAIVARTWLYMVFLVVSVRMPKIRLLFYMDYLLQFIIEWE